jgi:hypothetical protein
MNSCTNVVEQNLYLSKVDKVKYEISEIRGKLGFILKESVLEVAKTVESPKSELDYQLDQLLYIIRTLKDDIQV